MPDFIYTVDPTKPSLHAVAPVTFSDIGVKERRDLEKWVCANPEVLGEPLLIVTSEFHHFDKTDERLDVLALDEDGRLVVVELKLELYGTPADQQAIRYAAFCSNMTMADVVSALAAYSSETADQAKSRILEFLDLEDLPELNDRPRIILAAGSLDDQKLTSVVLWLRKFHVDITCVELTPYRLPGGGGLLLVPRVIIPLPEAKEYVVGVERKEAATAQDSEQKRTWQAFWRRVLAEWNALSLPLKSDSTPSKEQWHPLFFWGKDGTKYVWLYRKNELAVALEFRGKDGAVNAARLALFSDAVNQLRKSGAFEVFSGPAPKKKEYARIELRSAIEPGALGDEDASTAVRMMKALYEATWPVIKANGIA